MIRQVAIVRAILLIAMLFGAAWGQNEPRRIGSIDFYGYAGLNLEQIKPALPPGRSLSGTVRDH